MNPQDINTFKVGSTITVPGIQAFEKTKILSINDSGVTVSSNEYTSAVISGKTPAVPYIEKIKEVSVENNNSITPSKEILNMSNEIRKECNNLNKEQREEALNTGIEIINSGRAKRGSYKDKMNNIVLPNKDKFTIAELAQVNDIPVNYANIWAKENLIEAGKADKVAGQRGRQASLYSQK